MTTFSSPDQALAKIADRPMEAWENRFTKISHLILLDENLVEEPFMLTSVDERLGTVTCRCFYASVVFSEKAILVFHNDAGGMCPIELEYLHKAFKPIEDFDFKKEFGIVAEEAGKELEKRS